MWEGSAMQGKQCLGLAERGDVVPTLSLVSEVQYTQVNTKGTGCR